MLHDDILYYQDIMPSYDELFAIELILIGFLGIAMYIMFFQLKVVFLET